MTRRHLPSTLRRWRRGCWRRCGTHEPAVIVFDGNVPRQALLEAAAEVDTPLLGAARGRADPLSPGISP